ncbi:hypothetical protein [Pseudalkalibacillus caeni]|uniref:Uncharacterized protein n=1 Tax=Exobacillus caeni TaxID=2574798 RepID=A0A5R9EZF9_9BACL|nr:hypothetical protein [Pseudalkalibacillus caeni]TLS36607.1 hypothetical protein FCL54_13875 [Pseudalkalibacillus caeni]
MPEQTPFFPNYGAFDSHLKLNHDTYNVYINDEYIGNKMLFSQNETMDDMEDHLRTSGFYNFQAELEGDHYRIQTLDEDESDEIKFEAKHYLSLR